MNKEASKAASNAPVAAKSPGPVQAPVREANVNTANLKSSYCNMCSVNATREEVVLNFGVNTDWERAPQNPDLSLEHRVVLNPALAKRLMQLLAKVVEDYEGRHGALG